MNQKNDVKHITQANRQAIATLIKHLLQEKNVDVQVGQKGNSLLVFLESDQSPDQNACVQCVDEVVEQMGLAFIQSVKIYGRCRGANLPDWAKEIEVIAKKQSTRRDAENLTASSTQSQGDSSKSKMQRFGVLSKLIQAIKALFRATLWTSILVGLAWLLVASGLAEIIFQFMWSLLAKLTQILTLFLMEVLLPLIALILILLFVFVLLQTILNLEQSTPSSMNQRSFNWKIDSDRHWVEPHWRKTRNGKRHVKGHWRKNPK